MKRLSVKIVQWVLALVFAVTAGLKLAALSGRGSHLQAAPTMFSALPTWGQWALVAGELVLAVWLASGWRSRLGAFLTIVVLSGFLAAVIVEMGKSNPHSCGCAGALPIQDPAASLWVTLSADSLLLLLALWVYFASLPSAPRKSPDAAA